MCSVADPIRDKCTYIVLRFTGSAGQAIIGLDEAHLLTDSRYWLQAQAQLDNNWQLVKVAGPDMPKSWVEWLPVRGLANKDSITFLMVTMLPRHKSETRA